LLVAALVVQGFLLFRPTPDPGRWRWLAGGLELAAILVLGVALALAVRTHGEWSPHDLMQVALGLALATLAIHWLLVIRHRSRQAPGSGSEGIGLIVDLIVLGTILFTAFAIRAGGGPLLCAQRAVPYSVQWALYLVGAGAVLVAGSAGVVRVLRLPLIQRVPGLRQPRHADLIPQLAEATWWALVVLGLGLVVGVWWAGCTVGRLTSGDPREGWMVITWLAAASSLLARRFDEKAGQWSAALAVVAAVLLIIGLLALPDLYRLLGL
jgi:ABC-type transport system involved in cytochrome c biogenesis permease subunit